MAHQQADPGWGGERRAQRAELRAAYRPQLVPEEWYVAPADWGPDPVRVLSRTANRHFRGVTVVDEEGWRDAVAWVRAAQRREPGARLPDGPLGLVVDLARAGWEGPHDCPGGQMTCVTGRQATLTAPGKGRWVTMVAVITVSVDGPDPTRGQRWGPRVEVPRPVVAVGNRTVLLQAEWRALWAEPLICARVN